MCDVEFARTGDTLTVYLKGEIDHHTAKSLSHCIDSEIYGNSPEHCIMDFTGVGFMDSSGIGLILGRHRLLAVSSKSLSVQGVGGQIEKVLAIAGISKAVEYSGGSAK